MIISPIGYLLVRYNYFYCLFNVVTINSSLLNILNGNIGFRDDFMYDWINHKNDEILKLIEINREECVEVQQMWLNKKDRIEY